MKFSGATIRVRKSKSGVVAFVAFVAATFVVATFVVTAFVVATFAVTAMMMAAAVAAVVVTTRTGSPSLMAEAGGKFLKGDTASFISVESSEDTSDPLRVFVLKGGQGSKFVRIKAAIFACDLGKLLFALGLEGFTACFAGGFLFFVGEFTVAVGIEFRNALGTAFGTCGTPGFPGGLTLFFVNLTVFVQVKLLKDFGQFAITEGAVSGTGGCDPYADGKCKDREVSDIHGSYCA